MAYRVKGSRKSQREPRMPEEKPEFIDKTIQIDRVTRVQAGGRRFRFRATVVTGDGKNRVGIGIGKAGEVAEAIKKATDKARKNLITVPLKGGTLPYGINIRHQAAHIVLKPASPGTGIIAGGALRVVLELGGVKDVLSKILGSSNKINNVSAAILALEEIKAIQKKHEMLGSQGKKK